MSLKHVFLVLLLINTFRDLGQCPFAVTLTGPGENCLGTTLTVSPSGSLSKIIWYNGMLAGNTVLAKDTSFGSGITVAGGNGNGNGANQLAYPDFIFVDAAGNIYVSDEGNNRVQKWPPGATSGVTVAGGNGVGAGPDQLNGPFGIFVDKQGTLYVVDEGNNRVQKWPSGATSGSTVAGGNGTGSGPDQFFVPVGIYVDEQGNLYVSDEGNNRVQKWPPGATSGSTVAGGNGKGNGAGQLDFPEGVYVDGSGNLYVADANNYRVQKWAPGATSGITVAGGNGPGAGANQLYPDGIYVEGNGNIYIADSYNNQIQKWAPGATSGITVAGGNGKGSAANQFSGSGDVRLDNNGNIYICDNRNNRVQEWVTIQQTSIDSTYIPATPGSYTAVVTDKTGCVVTTNAIVLLPTENPLVSITAPDTAVCSGQAITFMAGVTGIDIPLSYQWLVNGVLTEDTDAVYTSSNLGNGDSVACLVTSTATCVLPASATSVARVTPSPSVDPGQVFTITYGQSSVLQPGITGDIVQYKWTPSTGISDSTIRDPVANPPATTVYNLRVVSANGCQGTGEITVKVNSLVRIPNAFTPNGDGKNDVFYILGGPAGSRIKDFSIFNRWGAKVFQVHNVSPGDPDFGWTGRVNGQPAPAGTYVYMAVLTLEGGQSETYSGTVILIR